MQFYYPPALPISEHRDSICAAFQEHQVVIVAGDTGSGKTTQLPKMCLEAGLGKDGKIIGCTQPRRIAAISVSQRVGQELDDPDLVGYKIRFQDTLSDKTTIKFMTDGVLLAETHSDRLLEQYDAIIIDEAHERSLNIDFLIGYLKNILSKRKDLKIIISSATIDVEKFSKHFSEAPIISVAGRVYPIQIIYQEDEGSDSTDNYVDEAVAAIQDLCKDPFGGDILVFMPTERDIHETIGSIDEYIKANNLVLPLFGRMQAKDQQRIFRSSHQRKIIVATNVAETSITVPGIRFVIDTGLARISKYNPGTGTTNLKISKISQASCQQRMGRCGRTGPGTCIRLYNEQDFLSRDEFSLPEVQRSNLAEVILQMITLNLGKIKDFPFLDKPHPRAVREGFRTLRELKAITEENRLTKRGRMISSLPLDPRISSIIIQGFKHGSLKEVTIIAAALSIQDPRVRPIDHENKADEAHRLFTDKQSDFITLLNIWNSLFADGPKVSWSKLGKYCKKNYLSWQRMREWIDVHEQLQRILKKNKKFVAKSTIAPAYKDIHIPLTHGFLRNIIRKKEKNIYQNGSGKEVRLFPGSSVYNKGADWLVSCYQVETSQLFARTAANIDVEWLEELGGSLCKKSWTQPRWHRKRGQVVADEHVILFGLPIVSNRIVNYGRINKKCRSEARDIFIREALIANRLDGNFPFLRHNQKLIKEYHEIEDRMRRKDIVVDEEQIFSFYDQNLGNTYDRFTLTRYLRQKKNDSFLRLSSEDICLTPQAQNELYLYPPALQVGEHNIRLSYLFEPGNDRDGVTALVTRDILPLLPPTVFEWLVPGLLEEKLHLLFKRLPKRLRKQLIPLPQAVDRVLDLLPLYEGSLYQNVEQAVRRAYQVTVLRSDWRVEELPTHLIMRFELLDKDKPIFSSRSFSELLGFVESDTSQRVSAHAKEKLPATKKITYKEFESISKTISFTDNNGRVLIYYPSFQIDQQKGEILLTYMPDQQESFTSTTLAIEHVYSQVFTKEVKQLKKECKQFITHNSASFLSLGGNFSAAKLKNDIFSFIMRSVFEYDQGEIPSPQDIDKQIEQVKKSGLYKKALSMFKLLADSLQARKKTRQDIEAWAERAKKNKSFTSQRYTEYKTILQGILPQNFLQQQRASDLIHSCRYLRALSIRIERAEHSPAKDDNKAKQLHQPLVLLEQTQHFNLFSSGCRVKLQEFRQSIEELRVSIFAPELGTAIKVSPKKIQGLWNEVENNCRLVE